MDRLTNDNLPRLFSWIGENQAMWRILCAGAGMEQEDFIETLQSLKEAGLYQMILVLICGACHYDYLHRPLQQIFRIWCEQQLTPSIIDGFLSWLLDELQNKSAQTQNPEKE